MPIQTILKKTAKQTMIGEIFIMVMDDIRTGELANSINACNYEYHKGYEH